MSICIIKYVLITSVATYNPTLVLHGKISCLSTFFQVEHVVREEKMMAAYDLIEIYCELIVARLPIIESQKYVIHSEQSMFLYVWHKIYHFSHSYAIS